MTTPDANFDLAQAISLRGFFLVEAAGSGRLRYGGAERISEAFDRSSAPSPGGLVGLVHSQPEGESEDQLIGLGIAGAARGIAAGTVATTITPLIGLSGPVNMSDLIAAVGPVALPSRLFPAPLAVPQALGLVAFLVEREPWLLEWLSQQLASLRSYEPEIEQARVEARDAVALAATIAEIELPSDALAPDPVADPDEDLLDSIMGRAHFTDLEEELLPLDLSRWDGRSHVEQTSASMAVFTDPTRDVRLAVFSVNKKPLELELGVDLFYWDKVRDIYTFVQYKRLERVGDAGPVGSEWIYRRRGEIQAQLDLMPTEAAAASSSVDWRMTDTPFWFKFVRGDAGLKLDQKVLKGMYVPADLLRLAVADGSLNTGPHGGFRVTYQNIKYLGRASFVQLVSRGLVGTTSEQSEFFRPILESLGQDRQLIVAVKDAWIRSPADGPSSQDGLPF